MANHSVISLKKAVTPEDVERAVEAINQRRFGGRLVLRELTVPWMRATRGWALTAPGTKPDPEPIDPEPEDLGFCFWLHKDGLGIETRHGVHNAWMRWVMYIHEHELARHFGAEEFDGGDGMEPTNPDQYKTNLFDWATRNLKKPLSADDEAYIQKHFTSHIPEGWT